MRLKLFIGALLVLTCVQPGSAQSGAGAFWRSLVIPGWGQHYAGQGGGRFIATELALWTGYAGFDRLGKVRADRFHAYVAEHAGADSKGKGDPYLDDLGFYESQLQHNQFALYEDGPKAQIYPTGVEFFWEWDREASRERYRTLRNESESAKRQALYTTGLVVANHLLSAIHAARSVGLAGKVERLEQASFLPLRGGAMLSFTRRF
jgi:hypothetical protein